MLLCNNRCSFSNWKSVSTMDTNYIVTQLKPVVDDLLQHKLKIVAIVTDNEANMRAAARTIYSLCGIVDIPCAAHTIQLIVRDMFKIPFIKQFNDKIETMLDVYASNKGIKQQYW
jgi:hypothetical protein